MELTAQAMEWIAYLRSTGRKETTITCYINNLRRVQSCLIESGRPTRAEDITIEDVRYLWTALEVKEEVRMSYLRTLAGLTIHFTGKDIVKQADILRNREMRDRTFISRDDFSRMLKTATPTERMILCLGGLMGLRRQEMRDVRDCDIRGSTMRIHGKGHGDGLVTDVQIPEPVMIEIARYREWKANQRNSGDGHLLQSMTRHRDIGRMSVSEISAAVKGAGDRAGVHATTHSLRRLFATTLYYDVRTDVQTVRNLMRHANASTTLKCYIEASNVREREAIKGLSDLLGTVME